MLNSEFRTIDVPSIQVVAAGGVDAEVAVAAVGGEEAAEGASGEGVVAADGEVEVVFLAVEASAHGFGFLPGVALPRGAVDVVAALAARAVAAEVEHAVALVVEGCVFVVGAVDERAEVDAFGAAPVLDEGVPDVGAAETTRAVADEVEDDGAVGEAAHGGVCGGVVLGVDGALELDGLFPSAPFFAFGEEDFAVEAFDVATSEVEVVGEGVEGDVASVFSFAVDAPAVGFRACHLAVSGDACLVDLHDAAAEVELFVAAAAFLHGGVDHHGVADHQGAGFAAGGVEGFLEMHHLVLCLQPHPQPFSRQEREVECKEHQ